MNKYFIDISVFKDEGLVFSKELCIPAFNEELAKKQALRYVEDRFDFKQSQNPFAVIKNVQLVTEKQNASLANHSVN